MTRSLTGLLAFAGATLFFAASAAAQTPAAAAEDGGLTDAGHTDKQACDGLNPGAACMRTGGSPGTCRPETKDSKVLVCDNTVSDKGDLACAGRFKGDPCAHATGASGICTAEDTNPGMLRCKEVTPANPSNKCSLSEGAATSDAPWAIVGLGLAAVTCARRKRR